MPHSSDGEPLEHSSDGKPLETGKKVVGVEEMGSSIGGWRHDRLL